MYTRCPECETTFKLRVADLRRAQGRVRCGDCNHVFNAVEYLAEQAKDKADDAVPVLSSAPVEESAFFTEESLPPAQQPESVPEPANEPQAQAMFETANDPGIDAANDAGSKHGSNLHSEHKMTGESWSPLEPSDDWLGDTGVKTGIESMDPAGILSDGEATNIGHDEQLTVEHILPPVDQGGLPTVTTEAVAPKIKGIEEATPDAETNLDEAGHGFFENAGDANMPVVNTTDEPEFQEASFGTPVDEDDAWSEPVYELSDEDAASDPVTAGTENEQMVDSGRENDEVDGPAPITEAVPDFDDAIWDRIPGVGATEDDWETVRSGQHRSLSEEDQLADGLSYTNIEPKIIGKAPDESDADVGPSVDDMPGDADSEFDPVETSVDVSAAEDTEYERPESPASDTAGEDAEYDPVETSVDVIAADDTEYERPESPASDTAGEDAEYDPVETSVDLIAAEDTEYERLESPAGDTAAEDGHENHDGLGFTVPVDKWTSFFGTEPQPSQQAAEQGSSDNTAPESARFEIDDAEEDPWQEAAAEASQTLSSVHMALDPTDFSGGEEADDDEASETIEDLVAEMTAAVDKDEESDSSLIGENNAEDDIGDFSDTDVSDETDTQASSEDSAAEDAEDDEHISTWSDLEPMEEIVLSTGIFDAAAISSFVNDENAAPEGALGQRTYQGEWQQPEEWASDDTQSGNEAGRQPPAWQSDYMDIGKTAGKFSRSWVWRVAIIMLVIGFPTQLIHYNRDKLAAHPSYGAFVRGTYSGLQQELYPAWSMDSYEIRGHEAVAGESGQDILDIRTQIAVVGETVVGLPHLRVILRDRWSSPLAARIFAPEEYAGAGELPADGLLQPNQTIAARVAIVDPGTGAQGYELELCLPRRNTGLDCTGMPFK